MCAYCQNDLSLEILTLDLDQISICQFSALQSYPNSHPFPFHWNHVTKSSPHSRVDRRIQIHFLGSIYTSYLKMFYKEDLYCFYLFIYLTIYLSIQNLCIISVQTQVYFIYYIYVIHINNVHTIIFQLNFGLFIRSFSHIDSTHILLDLYPNTSLLGCKYKQCYHFSNFNFQLLYAGLQKYNLLLSIDLISCDLAKFTYQL